jgi:hypothetical protein
MQLDRMQASPGLRLDDPGPVRVNDDDYADRVKTNQGVGRESSPHTYSLRIPVARNSRPPHTDRRRGRPTDRRTLLPPQEGFPGASFGVEGYN